MKFEDAVEYVLKWEGELSDDLADRGGLTKWGISQKAHPDVDIKNLTKEQAIEIYRKEYWEPNQDIFDSFTYFKHNFDKDIIQRIFDCLINIGQENTIKILQSTLRASGHFYLKFPGDIPKIDGIFGKETRELINMVPALNCERCILVAFKSERAAYYRILAAKDPTQEKFLKGWLRRAYT